MYRREDGEWTRTTTLTDENYRSGGHSEFGAAVAIVGDTALIGNEWAAKLRAGRATVFTRGDDGWAESATLTADDGDDSDQFGESVALTCGGTALIGAWADEGGGSAYVFAPAEGEWSQREKVTAVGTDVGGFGKSLAMNDGTALVAGTTGKDAVFAYDL